MSDQASEQEIAEALRHSRFLASHVSTPAVTRNARALLTLDARAKALEAELATRQAQVDQAADASTARIRGLQDAHAARQGALERIIYELTGQLNAARHEIGRLSAAQKAMVATRNEAIIQATRAEAALARVMGS